MTLESRRRWWALYVLCSGVLMIVLDTTIWARAPLAGTFWIDVFPGMALLGLGCGFALNPLLLAAMSDVAPHESGLASGIVNTAFMLAGALSLAVLASFAAMRTQAQLDAGLESIAALNGGYHLAFLMGGLCAAAAALIGAAFMLTRVTPAAARTTAH